MCNYKIYGQCLNYKPFRYGNISDFPTVEKLCMYSNRPHFTRVRRLFIPRIVNPKFFIHIFFIFKSVHVYMRKISICQFVVDDIMRRSKCWCCKRVKRMGVSSPYLVYPTVSSEQGGTIPSIPG